MDKTNNIQDEFLTRILRKVQPETPPPDFTHKVMDKINSGQALQGKQLFWSNPLNPWIWISGAAAIIIITLIFADFSFIERLYLSFSSGNYQAFSLLTNILSSLSGALASIKVSSVSLIIIFSSLSLFLLDRAIRKIKTLYFFLI